MTIGVFLLVLALTVGGCATPVGVRHLDPKQVQRNLTANILSSDELSSSTQQILNRANLTERYRSDPPGVLAELHKGLPTASEEIDSLPLPNSVTPMLQRRVHKNTSSHQQCTRTPFFSLR